MDMILSYAARLKARYPMTAAVAVERAAVATWRS